MPLTLGFSTLSLLWLSPKTWVETARRDGFNAFEILCEGPMWPRRDIWKDSLKNVDRSGISIYLHATTVDLNPASVNQGIREETLKQLKENIDMACAMGASYVTTHPGIVHKPIPRVMDYCIIQAKQLLGEATDYARSRGVALSIENMPMKKTFLCTSPEELRSFQKACGCSVTIDVGHAVTCPDPMAFMSLPDIAYLHVNDNNGIKDEHLCPGDGILDPRMLKLHERMIIELNDYNNVLRAKEFISRALGP